MATMAMSAKEIIEREAEAVLTKTNEEIENRLRWAKQELAARLESLKMSASIVIPVDVLKILGDGGIVRVGRHAHDERKCGRASISINIDGRDPFCTEYGSTRADLNRSGVYRVTLIVERLPDEEANRSVDDGA